MRKAAISIGVLIIFGVGFFLDQKKQAEEQLRPVTWISPIVFADGKLGMLLTANRVYGSTEKGLPNPNHTFSTATTSMEGGDIYVIQTKEDVEYYVFAGYGGKNQYFAFPDATPAELESVRWSGARLIFIRNGVLIAATQYQAGIPLTEQLNNLLSSTGGTLTPVFSMNGRLDLPGYCLDIHDLSRCQYGWITANATNITGIESFSHFEFLVLEHVSISDSLELPKIFVPITRVEYEAFTRCLPNISPNKNESEFCT